MAVASSFSTTQALHQLLRRPAASPPPLLTSSLRPLFTATTKTIASHSQRTQLQRTNNTQSLFFSFSSFQSPPLHFSPSKALTTSSLLFEEGKREEQEESDEFVGEIHDKFGKEDLGIGSEGEELESEDFVGEIEDGFEGGDLANKNGGENDGFSEVGLKRNGVKVPNLSVKEKKELASYAHGLGKKLKCQLVGKSGVTDNLGASFIETLEANELLKIKIHRTCPGELEDIIDQLEKATGSVVVGQIGRTVIVYRPSLAKLKAAEKKKQDRRVFTRKSPPKLKAASLQREQVPRSSGRGRRGSSRRPTASFS